jgi:dipeptidyl aminopeptidase/acylaminoacyl peptidase
MANAPEGPRLAISVASDGPGAEDESWEVITTGPLGEDPQGLFAGGLLRGDLSWSGDGALLALTTAAVESTASGHFGTGWPVVGVAAAEDDRLRVFPKAFLNGGNPTMAPDGATVAFQRLKAAGTVPDSEDPIFKSAIWTLDIRRGLVRRLTRWRVRSLLEPISYLPDGSALLADVRDERGHRVVAVDLRDRRTHPVAWLDEGASEPAYSPDGSRLAFVRLEYGPNPRLLPARPVSELMVARADGSGAVRVLRTKGYISSPSWDPSGSRLAFVRDPPAEVTGMPNSEPGNEVMAINTDGTCPMKVFSDPDLTLYGAAWQPGIGREAGPIAC